MATDRSDLAFHFNPRFNECGKKVIVRNSFIGQKWGPEERQLDFFPFVEGKPFEVRHILYNLSVNAEKVADVLSLCCR